MAFSRFGSALFGFFESGVAESLGISATVAPKVATALPVFAMLSGLSGICRAVVNINDVPIPFTLLKVAADGFLIAESCKNFSHFTLGAPGLLPLALAVTAGADFIWAIAKYQVACRKRRDDLMLMENDSGPLLDGREHLIKVIKKAIILTGWCLVACGHPVGWALLLSSAVLSLFSTSTCLGGQGFFPSQTPPKLNSRATGGRLNSGRSYELR
jgi:hypothetical protein